MNFVPCPSCERLMPEARLTIEIAHGVCVDCNSDRPRPVYAQPCYGFKNNGASVVPADQIRAHAEGVKVVG
jgi:hypothetical protein